MVSMYIVVHMFIVIDLMVLTLIMLIGPSAFPDFIVVIVTYAETYSHDVR